MVELSPTNQFLFDLYLMPLHEVADLSNRLLVEACVVGADRGELCRKIALVDAIGNFRFPGEYPPTRRRLAA